MVVEMGFRHKKNGTIARMMKKKSDILKAIPDMNDNDLLSFNGFLTDVLSACANEMRKRNN
jgi:hypothetical protein